MFCIPYQISETEYSVCLVLEDENIDRLKRFDPASFDTQKMMDSKFTGLALRRVHICFAAPTDVPVLVDLGAAGNLHGMLEFLRRGWRYRPEMGDTDEPYTKLR